MMRKFSVAAAGVWLASVVVPAAAQQALPQAGSDYYKEARAVLEARLAQQPQTGRAKNVILFIGDGMGISTITAARIYKGQKANGDGESAELAWDEFPNAALSRTYTHDSQVPDSAATGTAMTAGLKIRNGVIGLDSAVMRGDCAGAKGKEVRTVFEMAEEAGKATGVVTTTRITHATPASAFAHVANRDWENDAKLGEAKAAGCTDIADQLVNWPAGDGFEVAFGGGRINFLPETAADPLVAEKKGLRTDGRDLTAEWKSKGNNNLVVFSKSDLDGLDVSSGARILGLFAPSHLAYEADRAEKAASEPSLAEMTGKALDRLMQDEDGFVLMVEAGRVDHAHHAGNAARALEDMMAFDEAVRVALDKVDEEDTLILVTADHSHTLTINGYPKRNNPILGLVTGVDGKVAKAADGKPYTTLLYSNGPGAVFPGLPKDAPEEAQPDAAGVRDELADEETTHVDYRQQALVPLSSETHSGEDVGLYAVGPAASLVSGTVEQNYIYHVISHATGLGEQVSN